MLLKNHKNSSRIQYLTGGVVGSFLIFLKIFNAILIRSKLLYYFLQVWKIEKKTEEASPTNNKPEWSR